MDDSSTAPPATAPVRSAPPHWLLEGIFIVVSVALGFGVAQFGEYRSDRQLAARALESLEAEMSQNATLLEPLVPLHDAWVQRLAGPDSMAAGQSAIDVYFAVRPQMPPGSPSAFPFLRRSAWDAALSGGALRLIDYDVVAALSDVYRVQEIATENVNRLAAGALSSSATFDPANRAASLRLLWLTMADITSAEMVLMERYRTHLPTLRKAAKVGE